MLVCGSHCADFRRHRDGREPKAMSRWEATKIIVLLIGIAIVLTNLTGLWQLPGQAQELETRAKAREERQYWEE